MTQHGGSEAAVELAQAIESLRAQLETARRLAPPGSLRFEVGPVELEFQVELVRGAEANAGAKFYVLSAGGRQSMEMLGAIQNRDGFATHDGDVRG
jgi:hypothetical protein